ncbi:hypothetical protein ENBRE01_0977 [Enteropsectra breve]|nr:hypothetical protein ENBRE01_0977 [Enteropsectra breve]
MSDEKTETFACTFESSMAALNKSAVADTSIIKTKKVQKKRKTEKLQSSPANVEKETKSEVAPVIIAEKNTSIKHAKRVSFNLVPEVKTIDFNNGKNIKKKPKEFFEVKDKMLVLSGRLAKEIKAKAKKFVTMVQDKEKIILKYRRNMDMDTDMRALGLKAKTYIENKIIVNGLGYKETEASISDYFSQFGEIEKIVVEKNKSGLCAGKCTVTFIGNVNTGQKFKLNGRVLRIERIKIQQMNTTRLHVSHMNKDINISKFRMALKAQGFVPSNIQIELKEGRNKGYGFVEFKTTEESARFMSEYDKLRSALGAQSFVEFSKEKKKI